MAILAQILVEQILSFKMSTQKSKLDKNSLQKSGKFEATSNFYMITKFHNFTKSLKITHLAV